MIGTMLTTVMEPPCGNRNGTIKLNAYARATVVAISAKIFV